MHPHQLRRLPRRQARFLIDPHGDQLRRSGTTRPGGGSPARRAERTRQVTALDVFHALGDSSRRAMVERLARGPASVSELAHPFQMALPTIVQHLGVLETAGIVTSTKVGRVRSYQLVPEALTPAAAWIGRQRLPAERRLDRLGTVLNRPITTTTKESTT